VTLAHVIQELTVIEQQLARILDDLGKVAIRQAKRDLEALQAKAAKRGKSSRRRTTEPWAFAIPPGNPLRFVPTTLSAEVRHRLVVDVFCQLSEPRDGRPLPGQAHNIVIRVWTEDQTLWFREGLDDSALVDQIKAAGGRRVIHRVHFDFANAGQPGPQFHLQIGGGQHGAEFCWFPGNFELPRFPHMPICLITACEFVVRTFFPAEYERIAHEATWIGAIRVAQDSYALPYLKNLLSLPTPPEIRHSLLARAWNKAS
jgi:hypothetical protein